MDYEPIIGQSLRQTVRNRSGKELRKVDCIRYGEDSAQDGMLPSWEEEVCPALWPDFQKSLKVGISFLVLILTAVQLVSNHLILRKVFST